MNATLQPFESLRRKPNSFAAKYIARIAPGLFAFANYRFAEDFQHDLVAGLSVAAVALPISIAYAELAGFSPVVGLYSSILPLVAYAVFGTSRQLMVNPDAATCAMVAAAIAPLAAGNADLHLSLSVGLAFLAGVFCIVASFFRLGALADFLSRPILVGFLNGVAISILLGQVGKLLGFNIETTGIVPRLIEIFDKLSLTHFPTLVVGVGSFAVLSVWRQFIPRFPAALVVLVAAGMATALLDLESHGIAILGRIPAGLPAVRVPIIPLDDIVPLTAAAAGLALVLFTSGTLTSRSFATKGGYEVDVDRDLAAFGVANIASALSQGFAVTGAGSCTATAVAAGGRTQVTGLVAAATIAVVLLFLTEPLRYVPVAALAALLISAAFSLFDVRALRELWTLDRGEFWLSVITMLGVVAVGAIHGILVALALALARFIKQIARPRDEILGEVEGLPGFHSIERHATAQTFPGIVIYRFNGPLTFFNADHFKRRALEVADAAGHNLQGFIIDAIPICDTDLDGLYALRDLDKALEARGTRLVLAGRRTEFLNWLREIDRYAPKFDKRVLPTIEDALKAFGCQAKKIHR